jgi:hypothetical protein
MRQKSTTSTQPAGDQDLRLHSPLATRLMHELGPGTSDRSTRSSAGSAAAAANRRQARRDPRRAATRPLASPPTPRPTPRHPQLLDARLGSGEQHDLRAPPQPGVIALRLMRDEASGMEVVEPTLHALAMRAHEPRPLRTPTRDGTPANHRRKPDDELLDRTRKPPRPRRVPKPEQVALHRVHPRLDPIITRRNAPPPPARTAQQRAHHQPPRLRRQRRPRRPIPTTRRPTTAKRGCAFQRHRQRPKTPGTHAAARSRADARGAAGQPPSNREQASESRRRLDPSTRGCRSVRHAATVEGQGICRCSSRNTGMAERPQRKTGGQPGLSRFEGDQRGERRLHALHPLTLHAAGGDPLTNLGQERVAQVQIQRNALETAVRQRRNRLTGRACFPCIS